MHMHMHMHMHMNMHGTETETLRHAQIHARTCRYIDAHTRAHAP
jgi:hypothetical protein